MVFFIIGGAVVFGLFFLRNQRTENPNLLTGRVPDTNLMGDGSAIAPPNQTDKTRVGPPQIQRIPESVFTTASPATAVSRLSGITTLAPLPPKNDVQISPTFAKAESTVFSLPPQITPAPAPTKLTTAVHTIAPLPFSPPKDAGSVGISAPLSGGLFSQPVKPPPLVPPPPSLTTSLSRIRGL